MPSRIELHSFLFRLLRQILPISDWWRFWYGSLCRCVLVPDTFNMSLDLPNNSRGCFLLSCLTVCDHINSTWYLSRITNQGSDLVYYTDIAGRKERLNAKTTHTKTTSMRLLIIGVSAHLLLAHVLGGEVVRVLFTPVSDIEMQATRYEVAHACRG